MYMSLISYIWLFVWAGAMIVFGGNDGSQEGLELPKLNSKRGISSIV